MNKFTVDRDKCIGCGLCTRACPAMLIELDSEGKAVCQPVSELNWSGCWKCQHCLSVCPQGAISVFGKDPADSLPMWPSDLGPALAKLVADRRPCTSFREEPVDGDLLNHILEVMQNTPTGGNKMMVEYTVVTDQEILSQVSSDYIPALFVPHVPGKYENTAEEIKAGTNSTPVIPEEDDVDTSITLAYFELLSEAHGLDTRFVKIPTGVIDIPENHAYIQGIAFGYPKAPKDLPENMGEMMDSLVAGRVSGRHYKAENVSSDLLAEIMSALKSAGETSGRGQVEFNLISDKEKTEAIRSALVAGYEANKAEGIYPYSWNLQRLGIMESRGNQAMNGDMFFCSAPHLFIPHMDKDCENAPLKTSLNLAYFELLAWAFGLGAIYLGFSILVMRMMPEVYAMLEVPEGHFCVNVVGFGYPEFQYARGKQKDGVGMTIA